MNTGLKYHPWLLVLTLALLLSACVKTTPTAVVPSATDLTPSREITPTLQTPEVLPYRVILYAPPGTDPAILADLTALISELAQQQGWIFSPQEVLTNEPWKEPVKIVIALQGVTNLMELVGAHPEVQFLAINVEGAEPAVNLSTLSLSTEDLQRQAFLAGYLAVMLTPDYRVGVLAASGDEMSQLTTDSFYVGAQYFCGLCNSRFGPIEYYPKMALIENPSSESSWQAAVDLLISRAVNTVYIQKEVITPDLLNYLSANKIKIISPMNVPGYAGAENWIGTLNLNPLPGLQELWPELVAGKGGLTGRYAIELINTQSGLISEGRLNLFTQTMKELMNGFIRPSSVQ